MRSVLLLLCICRIGYAQFPNVLIAKQLEPKGISIAINPKNPSQQVAGVGNANAYFSHDNGVTWKKNENICDAFIAYGNPRMLWDTTGKAFFTDVAYPNPALVTDGSWVDRIVFNRSDSAGKKYTSCEDIGKNGKRVQFRHYISCDERTNAMHLTWTQFARFESNSVGDSSFIRYSRTTDGGKTWSEARTISAPGNCANSDSTVMGAVSCTGLNGEVYVCWAGPEGLAFTAFKNGWPKKEKILAPYRGGWDYKVNGIYKANGLPSIACDKSRGPFRGRIYICWSDERNGENNEDVFYMYSDDGGENWIDPVILTYHPNHKAQFMPVMTIDQSTGIVYFLYYDQKNYLNGGLTDVTLALTRNGAQKFEYYTINEQSFNPGKNNSFGDYLSICAVKGIVRPVWIQEDKRKELYVYTAIVDENQFANYNGGVSEELKMEKMVPFSEEIKINFTLTEKMEISAALTRPMEHSFEKVIVKKKKFKTGTNSFSIKTKDFALQKGSYVLTLYFKNKTSHAWITAE